MAAASGRSASRFAGEAIHSTGISSRSPNSSGGPSAGQRPTAVRLQPPESPTHPWLDPARGTLGDFRPNHITIAAGGLSEKSYRGKITQSARAFGRFRPCPPNAHPWCAPRAFHLPPNVTRRRPDCGRSDRRRRMQDANRPLPRDGVTGLASSTSDISRWLAPAVTRIGASAQHANQAQTGKHGSIRRSCDPMRFKPGRRRPVQMTPSHCRY